MENFDLASLSSTFTDSSVHYVSAHAQEKVVSGQKQLVDATLAACGVDGEIGVAVAGDLKALAAGAMRSIGRVNWLVHGPIYESMGADLLAKDDEL